MAKTKTVFFCTECGNEFPMWAGKCPACGSWNTLVEAESKPQKPGRESAARSNSRPFRISEVDTDKEIRFSTGFSELDRVLGGGVVDGSLVLVGGAPGIGKSTLLLQLCGKCASDKTVLYVTGEESGRQIKLRADRLGISADNLLILVETDLAEVLSAIGSVSPDVVIIDSIQTMYNAELDSMPGSVGQIKECTSALMQIAKGDGITVFIVGHINKEGSIAGPKILEHMVDTVLQFEGDQHYIYRIVRAIKNRFGSTAELGIYEMRQNGLREVTNPSELLLSDIKNSEELSGVAIASAIEGVRPLLIETQALVSTAAYGTPQRSATGFDLRRLNMLLAVLEKRVGFKLGQKDVYLNIAGGIRVTDPAIDLSVIAAVLSSNVDTGIDRDVCMAGEVGLSGEIRPVSRIMQRIAEAEKLGFSKILIPSANLSSLDNNNFKIEVKGVRRVEEALRELFG